MTYRAARRRGSCRCADRRAVARGSRRRTARRRSSQAGRPRAAAGAVADASGVAAQAAGRRRLHPAMARSSSRFACPGSSPTARCGRRSRRTTSRTSSPSLPHDGDTVTVGDSELDVARGRHDQLQRQPLSLRLRAEQADLERALLGRHRRQRAARDERRAPGHRLERRVGVVGQRHGSDRRSTTIARR